MARRLQRDRVSGEGGTRALASTALRRRVMVSVRGEATRRGMPPASAGAVVALVLACTLALAHGSSARLATGAAGGAHQTRALLRRSGYHGELAISDMPEPPVGETYEVWLVRSGEPPKATDALFSVTSAGRAAVDIPGSLRGVSRVAVTVEPLGGSATPTGPAVLSVSLDG
jgi:anti-sigma-K factor RskA